MESLTNICLGISILIIVAANFVQSEQITVNNKIITEQQRSIDSLKVELIRIDSTLKSWDKEYQENLDMSNNLVEELEKYENN